MRKLSTVDRLGMEDNGPASEMAAVLLEEWYITIIGSHQMYYYDKKAGIWRNNARDLIKKRISERYPRSTISDYREVLHYIEARTFKRAEEFQPPDYIIPFRNVAYNIKLGMPELVSPNLYLRHRFASNLKLDKNDKIQRPSCPKFISFLNEILPDPQDRYTVLEAFASVLIQNLNLDKAFMFIGSGANGKSTLFKIMKQVIGPENTTSISIHSLIYNRFAAARLLDRVMNFYVDISGSSINELNAFKLIVSGDQITVENKNQPPFEFEPKAKHFFAANKTPEIKEDTDAVFRRFVLIEFPIKLQETRIPNHDASFADEYDDIMTLLFNIAKNLYKRKRFLYEQSIEELRIKWKEESDPIFKFKESQLIKNEMGEENKKDVYKLYVEYCLKKHYTIKQPREFTTKLRSLGMEDKHKRDGDVWLGYSIPKKEKQDVLD